LRLRRGLAVLAAVVLALAGCAAPGPSGDGFEGAYLETPYQLPEAVLTDTSGADFNLRTGSDRPVLVLFFGYTNCPDICLGVLSDLATALNRLDAGVRDKVQVLFITVDPDRDTAPVMREYLDRIDPGFIGLTAPLPVVEAVAGAMGVAIEGRTPVKGGYEVTHSTQLIGFDADRLGRLVWVQGTPIGTLRADLAELVRQQG
jgi:protein SCO1/2